MNKMNLHRRNCLISIFVIIWLIVFHYESLRTFYLNPLVNHELPKLKFLYPPAGWIMFYHVGPSYGYAEVYGLKNGQSHYIDPHHILQTRAIGYDNINRNALVSVLHQSMQGSTCVFLKRKFPYFDSFMVVYANYPDVVKTPFIKQQTLVYQCP